MNRKSIMRPNVKVKSYKAPKSQAPGGWHSVSAGVSNKQGRAYQRTLTVKHSPTTKTTRPRKSATGTGKHYSTKMYDANVNSRTAKKVGGAVVAGAAAYGGYKAVKAYRNHKQGTRTSNPTPTKAKGRVRRKG